MKKELRAYKKQLKELLKSQNIKVKSIINLNDNEGYRVFLKYKSVDMMELNFLKRDIANIFKLSDIHFKDLENNNMALSIYKAKQYLNYRYVSLSEYELLLGYNQEGYIIADMSKYPGILISGLPNQGKSKMVNCILNNLKNKADILVLNGFSNDYQGFTLVSGIQAIQGRIQAIMEVQEKRKRPLYLVIEEMQVISKHKRIQEQLKELLSVARHYNIFIIGIIQNASKENCSYKDLFNCRVSFRQVDSSSYSVCLGINVEKSLEQRQFYFLSDDLVRGYTFDV